MAMTTGGSTGLSNDINVTPMIDVLLVLLIIFIMAVPMMRKAIDVQLPDPTPQPNQTTVQPDQIVLQVLPNSQYKINSEAVTKDNLSKRLKEVYENRPDKIIFVKGDTTVTYQDVIFGMDVSRGAGVKVIGIPPKDVAK
jgi:biopolymer transport protein TolR